MGLSHRRFAPLLLGSILAAPTPGQNALDGFNPIVDSEVRAMVVQVDGKSIITGSFQNVGGVRRAGLARLNADGTLDTGFTPGEIQHGYSVVVQADGKIVVVGSFIRPGEITPTSISRWNPNGTLDAAFNAGTNGPVETIALQADGKIVIGGSFIHGQTFFRVGRLNVDGGLDTSLQVNVDHFVRCLSVQADGKILLGGDFHTVGGQTRNRIARLNADGSVDSFVPNVSGGTAVYSLATQADGKILVGGDFNRVNGQRRPNIARLQPNGSLDTNFNARLDDNPGTFPYVYSLAVQADGKILLGGGFTNVAGQARSRLARLHPDGSLDVGFNPAPNSIVRCLAEQADGKILVGGVFSQLTGQARNNMGRLYSDGSLDTSLNSVADSTVFATAVQVDGKILIGGQFRNLGGQSRECIGRLNPDGTLDTSFNPRANDSVYSFAVQEDGKILVGGWFTILGGQQRLRIARLHGDGTLDSTFDPMVTGCPAPFCHAPVYAVVIQPDGKILVGGQFSGLGGQPRSHLGRLNADGSLDIGFNPAASAQVRSLALQRDGKILVAGAFASLGDESRFNFGRLNPDGSLDAAFNPQISGYVQTVSVQADGKILVAGGLAQIDGQTRRGIARLNSDGSLDTSFSPDLNDDLNNEIQTLAVQTDGKITFGGELFGRLNPDGSRDITFDATASSLVYSLVLQSDGKPLAGGSFQWIGGQWRYRIARLSSRSAAVQALTLNANGSEVTWNRSGSGPEVEQVRFEQSVDGTNYSTLGSGSRIDGGWRLPGVTLPAGQIFYLRARGRTAGGWNNASSSVIENVAQFWRLPPPFISSAQVMGEVVFQFSFTNTNAVAFSVLASTNVAAPLADWENLGAPVSVNDGLYQFTDPGAAIHQRRFYRLFHP